MMLEKVEKWVGTGNKNDQELIMEVALLSSLLLPI